MDMKILANTLYQLGKGQRRVVYTANNGDEITATRTDGICPHDFVIRIEKKNGTNLQIRHTRLFSDLCKKLTYNKKDADTLFCIIEQVNNGKDPLFYSPKLIGLSFSDQIDNADVNVFCAQLMMIEQDFNYGPKGCKYTVFDPPRAFFMHYIRWIHSQDDTIKHINSQASNRKKPPRKYNKPITCEAI